jgi:hypothetical protein
MGDPPPANGGKRPLNFQELEYRRSGMTKPFFCARTRDPGPARRSCVTHGGIAPTQGHGRLSLPVWYRFLLLSERHAEPGDASPTAGRGDHTMASSERPWTCPTRCRHLPDTDAWSATPSPHRHSIGLHAAHPIPHTPWAWREAQAAGARRRSRCWHRCGNKTQRRRAAPGRSRGVLPWLCRHTRGGGGGWVAQHLQDTIRGTRSPLCPQPL